MTDPITKVITMGEHGFPGIWQYILPEDFSWFRFPKESVTTCHNCYEVAVGNFPPSCRCCTHFHQMPNFMIGLALMDPSTRDVIEPVVNSGQALPQGLLPTPVQFNASVEAYSKDLFGRSPELNCVFMHHETFMCRLYPYRNSVCSTFFCQTDHGKAGDKFWDDVQTFAGQVEIALEQWCMNEIGLGANNYINRLNGLSEKIDNLTDPSSGMWTEDARKDLWADWFGREIEFFEACGKLVMSRRDELYEIARRQPLVRANTYEHAERLSVPAQHRHEAPLVPKDDAQIVSIDALWYKLQLVHKKLWALPYNEGAVVLSSDVTIEAKTRAHSKLPILSNCTHVAAKPSDGTLIDKFYLTLAEERVLRLFEQPQIVGEALFDTPELDALEDPREFLSKCMRRSFLVSKDA